MKQSIIKAKPRPDIPRGIIPLLLWAFFGNADDGPYGDEKWRAGREPSVWLAVLWWCRNPAHNWCFYVLGIADEDHWFCGSNDWGVTPGFSYHYVSATGHWFTRPMFSYVGKKRGYYIGWRPNGAFGISLNFAKH